MEEDKKLVERFSPEMESKILKKLDKLLGVGEGISEDQAVKMETFAIMDPSQIMMFEGRTEKAKRILCRFGGSTPASKIPKIDYVSGGSSVFPMQFLNKALAVLEATTSHVRMYVKKNAPITLETEDFRVFLAPKIEPEDMEPEVKKEEVTVEITKTEAVGGEVSEKA